MVRATAVCSCNLQLAPCHLDVGSCCRVSFHDDDADDDDDVQTETQTKAQVQTAEL